VFVAPRPSGSLRILWLPAIYLLFFALLPAVLGMPPVGTLALLALNTALIGLSERLRAQYQIAKFVD